MSAWSEDAQRDRFLARLAESPYDLDTRKVFADWLYERGEDDAAAWHRLWTPEWEQAKEWLTEFAGRIDEDGSDEEPASGVSLEDVVDAGRQAFEYGNYACVSGMGFKAEGVMADPETRAEFWKQWGVYTRTEVSEEKAAHEVFACSC